VINIEEVDDRFSSANPGLTLAPDAYAAVSYTSGSTGRPKGIPAESSRGVLHTGHAPRRIRCRISVHDGYSPRGQPCTTHSTPLLNGAAIPIRSPWLRRSRSSFRTG